MWLEIAHCDALLSRIKERELEKVNTFYLQKEAEVSIQNPPILFYFYILLLTSVLAPVAVKHPSRQEESHAATPSISVQGLIKVHCLGGRPEAIQHGPQQARSDSPARPDGIHS